MVDVPKKAPRRQVKSQRYQWNVSVVYDGEIIEGYHVLVMFRSNPVLKRQYKFETLAAIAADMTKVLTQGANAGRRLNFPAVNKSDRMPMDLRRARKAYYVDLMSHALSMEDACTRSANEILKSCEDVTESVWRFVEESGFGAEEARELRERIAELKQETNKVMMMVDSKWLNSTTHETDDSFEGDMPAESPGEIIDLDETARQPEMPGRKLATEQRRRPWDGPSFSNLAQIRRPLIRNEETGTSMDSHAGSLSDQDPEKGSCEDVFDNGVTREEIELLLGMQDLNPKLLVMQASCSLMNLRMIYLKQHSLYRLINLDRLLLDQGWDLQKCGVQLLKGIVVLCTHLDGWKLRRIISVDGKTMEIQLEDGSIINFLQISNLDLPREQSQLEYLVQEYNYQIDQSILQPLNFEEIIHVYYRLLCTGFVLRKLNMSAETPKLLLQQLLQQLVNPMPATAFEILKKLIIPISHAENRRKANVHRKIVTIVGNQLEKVFQVWLGMEDQSEDLSLEEEISSFFNSFQERKEKPSRRILVPGVDTSTRREAAARDPRLKLKKASESRRQRTSEIGTSEKEIEDSNNGHVRTRRLSKLSQTLMKSAPANQDFSYLTCLEIECALYKLRRDLQFHDILDL